MILEIVILLLAIPAGFLIAWLARDEISEGRKYFRILITVSIIGAVLAFLYGRMAESWTMGFIIIVSFISLIKSKDKNFAVKRFK